jgi:hypothetical protein
VFEYPDVHHRGVADCRDKILNVAIEEATGGQQMDKRVTLYNRPDRFRSSEFFLSWLLWIVLLSGRARD